MIRIDGLPTSKYGITLAKRCKWCYNAMIIANERSKDKDNENLKKYNNTDVFCCKDCKEEYRDWAYLRKAIRGTKYFKTLKKIRNNFRTENV